MYSDIFDLDQLNAGGAGAGAGRNARDGTTGGIVTDHVPLVSFKAGKMNLTYNTELSKYECVADEARGQVRLVWKEAGLQWQWYDRREKMVVDTIRLHNYPDSTFERVDVPGKAHATDRIYVWTKKSDPGEYEMYWMQDVDESKDDEVVASVNQYLSDPDSAAPVGSSSGTGAGGTGAGAMDTDNADGVASPGGASGSAGANNAQVDALSSILENLGMPQSTAESLAASGAASGVGSGSATGAGAGATPGDAAAAANRTLTLADLQGAMAGIQSTTAGSSAGGASAPALSEIVTPAAITLLLDNDGVQNRLMELLPEEQRNATSLQENLRSPQVLQTLRSLTSALLPDDDGNMDGFYSVLANFSLDPADGQAAMVANNPIQAFLDCVLRKVERDQAAAAAAAGSEGESGGGDDTQESKEE
jgi:26S proteasome regulatory subunit N13